MSGAKQTGTLAAVLMFIAVTLLACASEPPKPLDVSFDQSPSTTVRIPPTPTRETTRPTRLPKAPPRATSPAQESAGASDGGAPVSLGPGGASAGSTAPEASTPVPANQGKTPVPASVPANPPVAVPTAAVNGLSGVQPNGNAELAATGASTRPDASATGGTAVQPESANAVGTPESPASATNGGVVVLVVSDALLPTLTALAAPAASGTPVPQVSPVTPSQSIPPTSPGALQVPTPTPEAPSLTPEPTDDATEVADVTPSAGTPGAVVTRVGEVPATDGLFVTSASRSSKYYYSREDTGWHRIKPENQIWFRSEADLLRAFPRRALHAMRSREVTRTPTLG